MKHTRQTQRPARVTRGSGNVCADLGFGAREAADLRVKADLARQIHGRIKSLGLTQVRAAARLGLGQPDVSRLMNGRFTGYSTDRLIALLNALDVDVDIVLRPRKSGASRGPGVVRVRAPVAAA